MTETVAVAVDGMEPTLLDRWVEAGELPTIARLRETGTSGTARCSSLSSAKQWSTHFTGVAPEEHGIDGFTRTAGSRRAGDDAPEARELINLTDIGVKTYPELLDEAGYSVGLINPLPIWPPIEFTDGYCISGMLTPPDSEQWVHPPSLEPELRQFDYRIDVRYGDRPYGFVDDGLFGEVDLGTLHEDMFAVLDARIEATKHLLEHHETEFTYVLLKSIDIIQHCFWIHMTAGDDRYGDAILESYRRVDDLLNWVDRTTDANLLVFSDHGFKTRKTGAPGILGRLAREVDERTTPPRFVRTAYDRLFKSDIDSGANLTTPGRTTGDHSNPAAFLATGPDFGCETTEIRFEDLTATILALCEHPVPDAYAGHPIDSLRPDSERRSVDLSVRRRTAGDDSVVSERLYNLGYADMVDE